MSSLDLKIITRALRLPFITASILPFIAGSLLAKDNFRFSTFFLGLLAVAMTHLGANLINDYSDSRSGADWKDSKFYGLFGGSKLIQEGVLSEKFYFNLSILCFSFAFLCIFAISLLLKSLAIYGYFFSIGFLAFSYSHKPLQLSYHRLGEFIIFLLFGPALVMGGYYIQTQMFPTLEGFLVSLPFGFLTTAILFSNEVPDYETDTASGKMTWVSIVSPSRAYIIYLFLVSAAIISIFINIFFGFLTLWALAAFVVFFLGMKASKILKEFSNDKQKLLESSKLTIQMQTLASIILIVSILL